MLQYSIYSVISPEGCASILWRSSDKAEVAAEAMGITADRLAKLGLIDEVIPEPLGGAHRDLDAMCETIKNALLEAIAELKSLPLDELVARRRKKIAEFGVYKEG
jgi:acetyl-CoA carboxylase carboxyl transferase subunit alpha